MEIEVRDYYNGSKKTPLVRVALFADNGDVFALDIPNFTVDTVSDVVVNIATAKLMRMAEEAHASDADS